MLRRNFTMTAGIILVSGLLASPAFSADFQSKYYDLPLTNDWMAQKLKMSTYRQAEMPLYLPVRSLERVF